MALTPRPELNATKPVKPELDVPLVDTVAGQITQPWWQWLDQFYRWYRLTTTTLDRPTRLTKADTGFPAFDTTLGQPIWWDGTAWIEIASGGGGGGGVSSVTGTPPVVSSGGANPAISMPAASASVNGYLTSANWTTFNNKAPLASPVFTGDPQAPTPTAGDNDTSIATTAFVSNAVAAIGIGGMSTAEYTYSTTTTAPPSTGQLRGNNATQSAITAFYLHETNAVGIDITNALKIIATGVKILVQDKTNAANVQYYQTSGPAVDNGAYFTIPVAWTSTGSGSAFTAGRVIFAGFGIGSNNMPEAPTDGQIYGRRGSDTSWQVATGTFTDAPSDSWQYTRINGAWQQKERTYDLAGVTNHDIAVPAFAKAVQLVGSIFTTNTSTNSAVLRLSTDGTTFYAGASDYQISAAVHNTGSSAYATAASAAASSLSLTAGSDQGTVVPFSFSTELTLTRPSTTSVFHMKSYGKSIDTAAASLHRTYWSQGWIGTGTTTALTIKAIRLMLLPNAQAMTSGSHVTVRWLG